MPPTNTAKKTEYAIQVKGLVKSFDDNVVLKGVDLNIRRGETLVIMGGSGSGKSTLLRCMIGSIPFDSGKIQILGQDISQIDEEEMNKVRQQFGILFQSGALFNSMTLRENVALPLQEHRDLPQKTIDIMVKIKLEQVGLREHADKYPAEISGGMKKRAGLARALALDPKILFYDEPSAGLDPITSAQIDQLIINLTKQLGVTSVVVTHEMDSAFTIADRMAMFDKGVMLCVEDRAFYEKIRDATDLTDEKHKLIRQFLRGDPVGPFTKNIGNTDYIDDLFSDLQHLAPCPSIQPTRRIS